MFNRLFICFFVALFLFSAVPPKAAASDIGVIIDNELKEFDPGPIMSGGRVLLPMRELFKALGAEVAWEPDTKTAVGKRGDIEVRIPIGSKFPLVNGSPVEIDVPASIIEGKTFLPLRFVGEALGDDVLWDYEAWSVVIYRDVIEYVGDETETGSPGEMVKVSPDIYRIEPSPGGDFHWPYFLFVPSSLKEGKTYLLVEGSNTGFRTDDQDVHESKALSRIEYTKIKFGKPLEVPTIYSYFPPPNTTGRNIYPDTL